jgi:hypothetical protein
MNRLKNIALVLAAVVLGVASVEMFAFPVLLQGMPTNLLTLTQEFGNVLAQSSKAGVIPRDYIVITGDSYAEGHGDALTTARPGTREPYASAHFIAQRLGRDVVTVGRGGWGSANAALGPGTLVRQAQMSLAHKVPPFSEILFYFYEGNDIGDNLQWARFEFGADLGARPYTPAEIASLVARYRERNRGPLKQLLMLGQANLPAMHFMLKAFDLQVVQGVLRLFNASPDETTRQPSAASQVRIGGKVVALPNRLPSPLADLERSNGLLVLKSSMEAMLAENPAARVTVIYVPTTLSSYDLVVDESARLVEERSAPLRRGVCEIARELGLPFFDTNPAIRAAARQQLLHGPRDWGHFNLEGYRVLGTSIADFYLSPAHDKPPRVCDPQPL